MVFYFPPTRLGMAYKVPSTQFYLVLFNLYYENDSRRINI